MRLLHFIQKYENTDIAVNINAIRFIQDNGEGTILRFIDGSYVNVTMNYRDAVTYIENFIQSA